MPPSFDPGPPRVVLRESWPFSLRELHDPLEQGYLWGEFPQGPYVAIVGRREVSRQGDRAARSLARHLAEQGVTIVSGGALGVDSAAHEGALDAGGSTLVVGPVWLERAYPKENRELFERVLARGGAYFSVAEAEEQPLQPAFFRRNEVIAALCQLMVVGECTFRSGARNAATHARRHRRPLFVLPSLYGNAGGAGSNALLESGAKPVRLTALVRELERAGAYSNPIWWRSAQRRRQSDRLWREEAHQQALFLDSCEPRPRPFIGPLGSAGSADGPPAQERPLRAAPIPSDPSQLLVWQAIAAGAVHEDAVCQRTGLGIPLVQYHLTLLTLAGLVELDAQGLLRCRS